MSTFDRAVRDYLPLLRSVATKLTRNSHDAEDIVQDALLRAFTAWRAFDEGHTRPWLIVIVRRCFLNECRRRSYRATVAEAEISASDEAWSRYIDAQRALESIAPEYRAVLELAMIGLNHEEIAAQLRIPLGTSRSRLNRARREVESIMG